MLLQCTNVNFAFSCGKWFQQVHAGQPLRELNEEDRIKRLWYSGRERQCKFCNLTPRWVDKDVNHKSTPKVDAGASGIWIDDLIISICPAAIFSSCLTLYDVDLCLSQAPTLFVKCQPPPFRSSRNGQWGAFRQPWTRLRKSLVATARRGDLRHHGLS